jgi:hypothetical protein
MQANELLIDAFGRIHQLVGSITHDLGPQDLTFRPDPEANTIAWLIWHLSRVQDDHIAEVAGLEQVWTARGWFDRFGLPFDAAATGYGQTSDEVGQVQVSADQLVGYHDDVHLQTLAFLKTLTDTDYDRVVDRSWDPPVTLGVRLVSVVGDNQQHAGQAAYVRGLVKRRGRS